jgi:hypothetical protein
MDAPVPDPMGRRAGRWSYDTQAGVAHGVAVMVSLVLIIVALLSEIGASGSGASGCLGLSGSAGDNSCGHEAYARAEDSGKRINADFQKMFRTVADPP